MSSEIIVPAGESAVLHAPSIKFREILARFRASQHNTPEYTLKPHG